ncbi:unnamed protein product [Blepharisma stoltei]|uniref:MORN repeat protein n=1 Tax=Blepharisma stoltei TaxID=1481888 RepID=A0AAU9K1B8_9CILI|nr:unnamed protein product [Blepharisma stoltei]
MGQVSCRTCDCHWIDSKAEVELRSSDLYSSHQGYRETMSIILGENSTIDSDIFQTKKSHIIKVQSLWRSYKARKDFKKHLRARKPHYPYFGNDEVYFDLSKRSAPPLYRDVRPAKVYPNCGVYIGEWRGAFRDGHGVMSWQDGSRYEGNWSWGRPEGRGKFIFADGDKYEGKWNNYFFIGEKSNLEGLGAVLWKEKVKDGYEWLWYKYEQARNSPRSAPTSPKNKKKFKEIQERFEYVEKLIESNKPRAALETHDRFGNAKEYQQLKYPDGTIYIGEFNGLLREGKGKVTWPDGDVYEGEWKNDKQFGWGKNIWKDGSKYIGSYLDNLKDGAGIYEWEEGTKYTGEWKDNNMHGVGKYIWPDQKIYLGEWTLGMMHGFGVLEWPDGRKYEGGWFQGKKHGEGVTSYANGKASKDVWRHGKIIKPDVN